MVHLTLQVVGCLSTLYKDCGYYDHVTITISQVQNKKHKRIVPVIKTDTALMAFLEILGTWVSFQS